MPVFDDPSDADKPMEGSGCACGAHKNEAEHDARHNIRSFEDLPIAEQAVTSAVMRALFPKDIERRSFLKAVGASTAIAAISQFFPIKTATEAFADAGPL